MKVLTIMAVGMGRCRLPVSALTGIFAVCIAGIKQSTVGQIGLRDNIWYKMRQRAENRRTKQWKNTGNK